METARPRVSQDVPLPAIKCTMGNGSIYPSQWPTDLRKRASGIRTGQRTANSNPLNPHHPEPRRVAQALKRLATRSSHGAPACAQSRTFLLVPFHESHCCSLVWPVRHPPATSPELACLSPCSAALTEFEDGLRHFLRTPFHKFHCCSLVWPVCHPPATSLEPVRLTEEIADPCRNGMTSRQRKTVRHHLRATNSPNNDRMWR